MRKSVTYLIGIGASLLLIAGCEDGSAPAPTPIVELTPTPQPTATSPYYELPLYAHSLNITKEELEAAKAKWESNKATRYEMTLVEESEGGWLPPETFTYTVRVEGDRLSVISVTCDKEDCLGWRLRDKIYTKPRTVEQLFELIDEMPEIRIPIPVSVYVQFHESLGYPMTLTMDPGGSDTIRSTLRVEQLELLR